MPTLDEMTTATDDRSELTMSVLMTPDMANFQVMFMVVRF